MKQFNKQTSSGLFKILHKNNSFTIKYIHIDLKTEFGIK